MTSLARGYGGRVDEGRQNRTLVVLHHVRVAEIIDRAVAVVRVGVADPAVVA